MILLDSSFLVAYQNQLDAHHQKAAQVMEGIVSGRWGTPFLLEYVLLEVLTVLLVRRGLELAIAVGRELLQAAEVEFVPCSPLVVPVFETFRSQPGRGLSFTDAALVTVARRRGIDTIATFGADFRRQPGLTVVPE